MEEARATLKHIRVSPQKARLVVDLIRGKNVDNAITILDLNTKAVSRDILKLLKSAIANAENTKNLDVDSLCVTEAYVDAGPVTKRMIAKAMGRGSVIKKRSSHITLVVGER